MTDTLPADWYCSKQIFDQERQRIFGRTWIAATHVARIPQPGCLSTTVAGWPLVFTRQDDGTLAGFHNTCRHRAAPLVWEGEHHSCKRLRCRYHGWQYRLNGQLVKTPGFGETVDTASLGLFEVHVAQWQGFVFVFLGDNPPPIGKQLAGITTATAGLSFERFSQTRLSSHTLNCNWKTYVENYLEGYHIPYLHPSLSREIELSDYRVEVCGRSVIHHVPTKNQALNGGFWAWLWPNVAFNVYANGMSLERINPTGPQTMEIEYTYLFEEGVTQREQMEAINMSNTVTQEDVAICEAIQRNLAAGIYHRGQLSPRHENGIAAFQNWVDSAVSDDNQPE